MPERYECDQCGACCRGLFVEVYQLDVDREPRVGQAMRPFRAGCAGLNGEIGIALEDDPSP